MSESYTERTNKKASAFSGLMRGIMDAIPSKPYTYVRQPTYKSSFSMPSGGGYGANITSIDGNKTVAQLTENEINTLLMDMAKKGEGTMMGKNTLGDRTNNPLNIKWTGASWQRQLGGMDSGIKASDGGTFMKFNDPQQGLRAARELITAPSYTSLTVDQALRRWSGAGVPPIKKIGQIKGGQGGIPTKGGSVTLSGPNVQNGSIVSGVGNVTTPYGGSTRVEKNHPGLDIANKIGTPIPAFSGGRVVDESVGHRQGEANGGNYVVIKDNQGNEHRYSHLNQAEVKPGDVVQPGQEIGKMGNSGASYSNSGGTGSHLDYRIKNAYGKYVNPYTYIKNYLK
jgi:murein DD-endopeptidase MepM/ murein hydrolase activator NlpD